MNIVQSFIDLLSGRKNSLATSAVKKNKVKIKMVTKKAASTKNCIMPTASITPRKSIGRISMRSKRVLH